MFSMAGANGAIRRCLVRLMYREQRNIRLLFNVYLFSL